MFDALNLSDMFQSTHSLRSATAYSSVTSTGEIVSIHALLAECDIGQSGNRVSGFRFNPRTPCGVRLGVDLDVVRIVNVSIHALLAECDV